MPTAYNTFAISTLMYVAQLEPVPEYIAAEERVQVLKMFPGPGVWITCEDLWHLAENFGLAKSAQSLECMARAAKLRVACLGCHFGCKDITRRMVLRPNEDNIFSRWQSLNTSIKQTDFLDRAGHWATWYQNSYCKVLVENVRWCKSKNICARSVLNEISLVDSHDEADAMNKIKREFQRNALKAIKMVNPQRPIERIRGKMERWRGVPYGISGLPGHYSISMARRIKLLATLVPPRVHAAVFTTMWNGWCTHRRFQNRRGAGNHCRFKCSLGSEDSLEHYCRCPVVLRVAKHMFHISYPAEMALDLWTLNSSWLDMSHDNLRGLALLVYGTYMSLNTIRHNGISDSTQAFQCIVQYCKLGCGGHSACITFLDTCWSRPMTCIC